MSDTGVAIRPAALGDAAAIAAIYNQGIAERSSTFETEPPRCRRHPGLAARR